jgi:hypothetical protein
MRGRSDLGELGGKGGDTRALATRSSILPSSHAHAPLHTSIILVSRGVTNERDTSHHISTHTLDHTPLAQLDNPLSAVDQHTAIHIFENCVKGLLKDKVVVWITHQLELLPQCNNVAVMEVRWEEPVVWVRQASRDESASGEGLGVERAELGLSREVEPVLCVKWQGLPWCCAPILGCRSRRSCQPQPTGGEGRCVRVERLGAERAVGS